MAMKTIRVTEEIHTKLAHLGLKSETYNDIIVISKETEISD